MVDVLAAVLGERSMTQTALVVAMLEAGYETIQTPDKLRNHVGRVLRESPERFRRDGKKWAPVCGV